MDGHKASKSSTDSSDGAPTILALRAYQQEMVEESMRQNIIVAMETGLGKTLIAIRRIQEELERCPHDKLVWFCVPTVALAVQQHSRISEQLSVYRSRVLSGKDHCEFWSVQTWNAVLGDGTRIVVLTHSILRDALMHGFVKIQQLSLLVHDEAHRVTKAHPANAIMQNFYHKAAVGERPCVLGLTASPIVNDKVETLKSLEANLDAISRTPKRHREDLLTHVHKPDLVSIRFIPANSRYYESTALIRLKQAYQNYDIDKDPWIVGMRSNPNSASSGPLLKALAKRKTWCCEQLRRFAYGAERIGVELGLWASVTYIHQCIIKFRSRQTFSFDIEDTEEERTHLIDILNRIDPGPVVLEWDDDNVITPKVRALIAFLRAERSPEFAGLVFVQTRAEVAVLSQLLSECPLTKSFLVSTFVGESNSSSRKFDIGELADIKNQETTLEDLRDGTRNLVITTNALEEGIDVSACNVVVSFEKPPNLKSFVQRRGRARQKASKYVLMLEEGGDPAALAKWYELEEMMRAIYEDEMRGLKHLARLEAEEDEIDDSYWTLSVPSTSAKIGLADAVSHLYHFCSTLTTDPYVDCKPIFHFDSPPGRSTCDDRADIRARVVLPSSVDQSVREACSKTGWKTEKGAKRDAALQAYVALHKVGLVDDNLLPLNQIDPEAEQAYAAVEKCLNVVEVAEETDILPELALKWQDSTSIYPIKIKLRHSAQEIVQAIMLLPVPLPVFEDIVLYWDTNTAFHIALESTMLDMGLDFLQPARRVTHMLLHSVSGHKLDPHRTDFSFVYSLLPLDDCQKTQDWIEHNAASIRAVDLEWNCNADLLEYGLIRHPNADGGRYIPHDFRNLTHQEAVAKKLVSDNNGRECYPALEVKRFPKRTDFLHPVTDGAVKQGSGMKWLLAETCVADTLPLRYALLAKLIPSITHVVQTSMIVDRLCSTVLAPLIFKDRRLVRTAITASSARELTDYQRLEFLGDSLLKYMTSLVLMAGKLRYHEGLLSHAKDHIVSNGSLSSAAIRIGLDPFIITKPFTGKKWRPSYNSDFIGKAPGQRRQMSTKILADVVESLIGASYLEGGPTKALECLDLFLPKISWSLASEAHDILHKVYDRPTPKLPQLGKIEKLISYEFNQKSLLIEAITHPSYQGHNNTTPYQRLEFLGDSILDNIVTTAIFNHESAIPTRRLHLIRSALVNADFLGYLCINLSVSILRTDLDTRDPQNVTTFESQEDFPLWRVMRHSSPVVASAQKACLQRYSEVEESIALSLSEGKSYPWTILAWLEPPKFFSDMIESLLGAIWIDTRGSLESCAAYLEHLGLIAYLKRVIANSDMSILHPKEELGQLADRDNIDYLVDMIETDGRKKLHCVVMMGKRELVKVEDGRSRIEVETRAADEACKILRREGRQVKIKENTDKSSKEDNIDDESRTHEAELKQGIEDNEGATGEGESETLRNKRESASDEESEDSDTGAGSDYTFVLE